MASLIHPGIDGVPVEEAVSTMLVSPSRGAFPESDVFDAVPPDVLLALLPFGRIFRYEPSEVLVRQGDGNEWLHVILHGQVGLEREQDHPVRPVFLGRLGPGELVGEYGLVDRRVSPCTARAVTAVETLRFQHLAIACTLYYRFPNVVPTFQTSLRRRLEAADARIRAAAT